MALTCSKARQTLVKIRADLLALRSLITSDAAEEALKLMQRIAAAVVTLDAEFSIPFQESLDVFMRAVGSNKYSIRVHTSERSIIVNDFLNLYGTTSLVQLPPIKYVGGSLMLADCTSLKRLCSNMTVDGDLALGGCSNLRKLPPGLMVASDLFLTGCTALTSLPSDLKVGRTLYVPATLEKDANALLREGKVKNIVIV